MVLYNLNLWVRTRKKKTNEFIDFKNRNRYCSSTEPINILDLVPKFGLEKFLLLF